jgi:hypothetical protein
MNDLSHDMTISSRSRIKHVPTGSLRERSGRRALAVAALLCGADSAAEPSDPMPDMQMPGLLGSYPLARDASGTSWQPDSTPMAGVMDMGETWMTMWHGSANLVEDAQGGPRGGSQLFSNSMLMFMGRRDVASGAVGGRVMISADPLMGPAGYPELFQTGETADGVHPLIDRQHPHNLLMEAAGTYSATLGPGIAVFAYGGIAGEPALGPPAFMHRFSGLDNPEAPLSHHWLDSTHVTYGVVTAGIESDGLKLETSVFNGREPDQHRYAVELRPLDSYSARLTVNPGPDLSIQVSYGRLASPEQLQPGSALRRATASATFNRMRAQLQWQTTLACGRNAPDGGSPSTAWLLESALVVADSDTFFIRAERVAKDELFLPNQPLYGQVFDINSASLGYIHDFAHPGSSRLGIGGLVSVYAYPSRLDPYYGSGPVSYLAFLRVKL